MQRRHDEQRGEELAEILAKVASVPVDENHPGSITRGVNELDLVRSGLDDTMRLAYQEIRQTMLEDDRIHDLRTAAYVSSIRKIARSYLDIGVF